MRVCGVLSGTSADGVDICFVDIEQHDSHVRPIIVILGAQTIAYPDAIKARYLQVIRGNATTASELCKLNFDIAETFAQAIETASAACNVDLSSVDLIASHGQTVWHEASVNPLTHRNQVHSTLQLGNPFVLLDRVPISAVVSDFRSADVAAGGQGSPLMVELDAEFFGLPAAEEHDDETIHVRALLNIGGISNMTVLSSHAKFVPMASFDCGPGNCLMDSAMHVLSEGVLSYDVDGAWASQGCVDEALLRKWYDECSYFQIPPPRTTGRELFSPAWAERVCSEMKANGRTAYDVLATLTEFTAMAISQSLLDYVQTTCGCKKRIASLEIVMNGGGARNPVLMARLLARLKSVPAFVLPDSVVIRDVDALIGPGCRIRFADRSDDKHSGLSDMSFVDCKEAVLFAWLGFMRVKKLPAVHVASITKARAARILGVLAEK
jgi:anhydro-N-acetylmuramic acid kinase